ncbi:MAG: hypothetical protein HC884_19000 [Chloroflexaceae bacterium]|nr:hypothetical protein [Chloroflexaceae bacterium]
MAEKPGRMGVGFLLAWLLVNILGWVVASFLHHALVAIFVWSGYISGFAVGAIIGVVQWLVLKNRILKADQASRWIGGTAVGWGIGWIVTAILSLQYDKYGFIIGTAATGSLIGMIQSLLLTPVIPRTWVLVPISTFAMAFSFSIGMGSNMAVMTIPVPGIVINGATMGLGGALYGVVSGFTLLLLLEREDWSRTRREARQKQQDAETL